MVDTLSFHLSCSLLLYRVSVDLVGPSLQLVLLKASMLKTLTTGLSIRATANRLLQ